MIGSGKAREAAEKVVHKTERGLHERHRLLQRYGDGIDRMEG